MPLIKFKRRYLFAIWCWAWFLLVVLLCYPISYGIFRLAIVFFAVFLWLGAILLFWQQKFVRFFCLFLALIISAIIIFPGYSVSGNTLREAYVKELNYYEGSPYVWGGENKFGIDCSGLVRRGLINANLKQGLVSFNPKLIKGSFSLWWYDTSAEALGKEYRNLTKFLLKTESINQLNHSQIQKGDIAVTLDGVHTLAYIGNKTWIEADPSYLKVIKVKIPEPNNPWFNVPVNILEWRQFETN